jgi:hypothetical protein
MKPHIYRRLHQGCGVRYQGSITFPEKKKVPLRCYIHVLDRVVIQYSNDH